MIMSHWNQMQYHNHYNDCGSHDMEYEECYPKPFHLPHWERKNRPKMGKRKTRTHFSLDPRKHPVSTLYEYCSIQNIQPVFEFYEIPQKLGIEYGCVVSVENYLGEARAFSKKTAKHQAAINLLTKLSHPDSVRDNELGPRRFVSETGVVSVHYESIPRRRSCFKNSPRMTPPLGMLRAKRVKWQDSSEGETDDENHSISLQDLSDKNDYNIEVSDEEMKDVTGENLITPNKDNKDSDQQELLLTTNSTLDVQKQEIDEDSEREGRFKSSSVSKKKKNVAITKPEDQDLMDEISEYLSDRLKSTSIENFEEEIPIKVENDSSDEVQIVELNDVTPRRKRKKRTNKMMLDGTQALGKKSCLKEVNPIGYLQEACNYFNCNPPSYNFYKEGSQCYRAICHLFESTVEEIGETPKEAKRLSAISMIRQLEW